MVEFKAILTELKILAYVGEHANVLKFYGACTEKIKQREVYLVIEYCSNGSLKDYLIKNGQYFVDSGGGSDTSTSSTSTNVALNIQENCGDFISE